MIGLNKDFYHQTVSTKQVEDYISKKTNKDLSAFFNQYLRTNKVPVLEYIINDEFIQFRYTNIVLGFDMPIRVFINDKEEWLFPNREWQTHNFEEKGANLNFDNNFYIDYDGLPDD